MLKKKENIVAYKKPFTLNIGFVIFFVIVIYVIFNLFSYFTKKNIAEYQVEQGSIAANNVYKGLAVRDETIVYAEQSGYINYYVANGKKVGVSDLIYTIDSDGDIHKAMQSAEKNTAISSAAMKDISDSIGNFINGYSALAFNEVSVYSNDLSSYIKQSINNQMMIEMADQINAATEKNTFFKGYSATPGVILYYVDDYEKLNNESKITVSDLENKSYSKKNLNSLNKVESGKPIYKIVNSEEWHIYFEISSDLSESLAEKTNIKVRFREDDYTLTVPFTIKKENDHHIMDLKLKKAMIRYSSERFVDVELILKEGTGLKIPNSAITEKDFYTIPSEYFLKGNDSDTLGVMLKKADSQQYEFVTPTIYYQSEDKKWYYIDSEDVKKGDILQKPDDAATTYEVGKDIGSLTGVYCINKGYAVFKQISIIYQNKEYAIVEKKTDYGIALYDHIALDASTLSENELIVK